MRVIFMRMTSEYVSIAYDWYSLRQTTFGRERYVTRIGYTFINVRVIANIPIRGPL